jgi:hypothetical protein
MTLVSNIYYFNIGNDLEFKVKQLIILDLKINITLIIQSSLDIKFSLNVYLKNKKGRE